MHLSGTNTKQLRDLTDTQAHQRRPQMERIAGLLHARPETRFEEHYASETLSNWLTDEGFECERGIAGLPTSLRARRGNRALGPTIAVLLEYDALPGIGHACGHNLIAAGGALAAIAAASALDSVGGIPGEILVIGTPGEEGGGGKVLMAEKHAFDGIDAVMMFHPADRSIMARHALAAAHLEVEFVGQAVHAAKNPEDGRSALAAAQLFMAAIDAMRQFSPPTARLHGVLRDGGEAANVVPAYTRFEFYVRDTTLVSTEHLVERVRLAAAGAAMATETTATVRESAPTYAEQKNNMVLSRRVAEHAAAAGMVMEEPSAQHPAGSSDLGNVSLLVPTICPYVEIADLGTPGHSVAFCEAAGSQRGLDQAATAAVAMAKLITDLFTDPTLLEAARAEFESTS